MSPPPLPSLLESIAPAPTFARAPLLSRLKGRLRTRWDAVRSDPVRRRRYLRASIGAGSLFLAGAGVGLYFWLRPVPQPDYLNDDLDSVMNYTLLTDEFNRLPVEQRLKLVGELIQRFRNMSSNDSVLLAAFAAGIAGAAREQITENGSRLAIDVWDKYAVDYAHVPDLDKEKYLDRTFLEFTKMMEQMGGKPRDVSDADRLDEGRRQAARGLEMMRSGKGPGGEALGRVFAFMNQDVGQHASAGQKVRGQQMMRDMSRHFRGLDIATGKPSGGG